MRIAILEDDESQQELTHAVVRAMGHHGVIFEDGRSLMRAMRKDNFDLLILDWCVPNATGYDVVQWVRLNIEHYLPVLFVTNQMEERRIVQALSAGADDYMVKPVGVSELAARLRALLRRAYPQAQRDIAVFGDYCFYPQEGTVTMKGEAVELKQKEFSLAYTLFLNEGKLLRRSYLQAALWGNDTVISSRSLDTHVSRVRNQLNLRPENGYRLSSVYSQGYRFESLAGESACPAAAHVLQ
jgi:DNA-binding response OmpR family regulator